MPKPLKTILRKQRFVRNSLLFILLVTQSIVVRSQQSEELEEIQAQIEQTQAQLERNRAAAETLQETLRNTEIAISRTARALSQTQTRLAENRSQQSQLQNRQQTLQTNIKQQQSQLAAQIKSAYMAGNYDYAKMLFNQQDAAKFERVLSYYQYVSVARREAIESFRDNIRELESVNLALEQSEIELNELLAEQQQQSKTLQQQQENRQTTLAQLNNAIKTDAQRVEQLQASAEALIRAIEQAQLAAQQQPTELDGLTASKGQLIMPAEGRFRRLFGDRRQGQVRWTGVIIEGNEGSEISAVYQGRVLYADWLKGFGLVTILDHGEGFMSVYGHSQALLTQPGDVVTAGQTIGLVGRSGGQPSPNLYFEIRHKGKAVNPSAWLKWR